MAKLLKLPTTASFKRGKDRTPRKRKVGLKSLISQGVTEGYQAGRGTIGRIGSAVDGAVTGAALGVAQKAGSYGLRGVGRMWRRKMKNQNK